MMDDLMSSMEYDANGRNQLDHQQMHSVSPERQGDGVGMYHGHNHGHGQQGYIQDPNNAGQMYQHDQAMYYGNMSDNQHAYQQHHQHMHQQHMQMDPSQHIGDMNVGMYSHQMSQHQMQMGQMNQQGNMGHPPVCLGPGGMHQSQIPGQIKNEPQDQDPYHFQEEENLGDRSRKCMHLSGLIPEPMTADDDYRLVNYGIGFTNMVARPTKGSQDLSRKEIKEGGSALVDKVRKFRPKIVVFNGKGIYEVFSGRKDFLFGKQPEPVQGTNSIIWVMPSSSARCAQLPRAADKVPYYVALRKLRDYLNGVLPDLEESEVIFPDVKGIDVKLEVKDKVCDGEGGTLMDLSGTNYQSGASEGARDDSGVDQPVKKKRGRPRKIRPEDGGLPPAPRPAPRSQVTTTVTEDGQVVAVKKRRGRPPKPKQSAAVPVEKPSPSISNTSNSALTNANGNVSMWNGGTPSSGSDACMYSSPGGYSSTMYQGTPPNPNDSNAYTSVSSGSPARDMCSPVLASSSLAQKTNNVDVSQTPEELTTTEESHTLDSPPPPSPSLGPADFSPPATLSARIKSDVEVKTEEEDSGLRQSSSSATDDSMPPQQLQTQQHGMATLDENSIKMEPSGNSIPSHNPPTPTSNVGMMYGNYAPRMLKEETPQDMSSKSLSGLVSLVDQIPSIAHIRDSATPGGQVNPDLSVGFNAEMVPSSGGYPPHSGSGNFSVSALTHSSPVPPAPPTPTSATPTGGEVSPFLHRPYATESPHYAQAQGSAYSVARPLSMGGGIMGMGGGPPGYPHGNAGPGGQVPNQMGFPPGHSGYSYGQYSSTPPYTHPSAFPYSSPAPIHVPGSHYPYPGAFPCNPPYQTGYPQNPMGFGSF
ncbi:unnamed protein product [Notodromas monacha]|uniref:G/T mismatch-specific thymine DNA glycosylase n=1 Tax=Notodromas monacha TaxID=399045 RepID=A0A7R9BCB3_9CRUS|nr:unnamed protein product [Notodromas monacha]CAG0912656.1 unnamed protein product [Notodromas monacha]